MAKAKAQSANIGALIDKLYDMRDKRLEAARAVDEMKRLERTAAKQIMDLLEAQSMTKAAGNEASLTVFESEVAEIQDWTKFTAYVKKTGEFDLMHRRISSTAYFERVAAGKKVPGIGTTVVSDYSLSKLQRS